MVEVMKIMLTSFKRSHGHTATLSAPTLQQAITDACLSWRLQDTNGQVWVSLLWGHGSFFLGSGVHEVLFVPSKSLFPQSCVNSGGSMVGSMATSSKRAYAIPRSPTPREPSPCGSLLLTCTSTGDTQTQFCLSLCGASGSWCTQGMFEPSDHLWRVWGLILKVILPLLPYCWGFPFAPGHGLPTHTCCSTTEPHNTTSNAEEAEVEWLYEDL